MTLRALFILSVSILLALPASATGADPVPQNVWNTPLQEPTPQLPPDTLLLMAERAALNGQYEQAVGTFNLVLAQGDSAPAPARAQAAFGLGKAALREGMFIEAVNALTNFLDQFPDDANAATARFLRGDAYLGLSMWEQAIADFRAYMERTPGLLDSYALERIADAQLGQGQLEAALASYEAAAQASRSLAPQVGLRARIAQIYLANDRPDEAVAQYDAILAVAQIPAYRAGIELLAARAEADAGRSEPSLARMERIFSTYPDRPEAYFAMQALEAAGLVLDDYDRGVVAFNYGDYPLAVDALTAYATGRALTEVPAMLHLLLGRAYREIGNTSAALTAFQTIVEQYPTDELFGEALLEQGRTLYQGGDTLAAIESYLRVANTYDYLTQTPEALWRAGYLYAISGQPSEARGVFERLADSYPNTAQAIDGLMLAASEALKAADTAAAERYFAEVAAKAVGEDQAQALLQVGRLALDRGDQQIATQALAQAAQAAPDSYYAARARDIAGNVAAFAPPTGLQWFTDDSAAIAEAEAWLRATFAITQEGALWALSPTLAQDSRLIRGQALWDAAAYDEARTEFDDLIGSYETDPLASYQLAIYLRGLGAYQDSIVAAASVIRAANVGTLDAPPFIARMRYPAYFLDAVQAGADRFNLDPLLLLSLIRHESLFDAYATAAAGEKGLTQVIPPTADYIAAQLGYRDFNHNLLFRPATSVEFGAFYLREQLSRFNENVTAALAGYNAGPGRALAWIDLSGGDHDLFLTAITIDSTRTYVQRIYSFYNIYRTLYGA
jgi:soluble lytic murein transglycosylase